MPIKITRACFKNNDPFFPSFMAIANQTWGGRPDADLMKLSTVLQAELRDFTAQRDKYVKDCGEPQDNGLFGMAGASKEKIKEFEMLMEDAYKVEIDLKIDSPIQLTKRKKTEVTPFQAAAVSAILEIIWPTDEGAELDKVEKK